MATKPSHDESLVYTLTPQVAFSPTLARNNYKYIVGSVLSSTETRHIEYKTGGYAIKNLDLHVRKYGSAFLNSGGGTLLLGVMDNGSVVGIRAPDHVQNSIKRTIKQEFKAFKPSVSEEFYEIHFVPTNEYDKFVLELHIRSGADNEIYVDREDKMFIRRDGSVQGPLWPRDIKEIVLEKYMKELKSCDPQNVTDSNRYPLISLSNSTSVLEQR